MATRTISLKDEAYNRLRSAAGGQVGRSLPLLTRNVDHFRRVPGLDVETY